MTILLLVFSGFLHCAMQDGDPPVVPLYRRVAMVDPRAKTVWFGKQQIGDRAESEMVTMAINDLPGGRGNLRDQVRGMTLSLKEEARPFHGRMYEEASPTLEVRAYAARSADEIDLIDLRWKVGDDPIRIVISRNAARFDFDFSRTTQTGAPLPKAELAAKLKNRVESAFPLRKDVGEDWERYDIKIPWDQAVTDGFEFSSNPEVALQTMGHWWTRVDAYTENNVFSILAYLKNPQRVNLSDGSKWFPDDFRQVVIEKAAKAKPAP